LVALPSERYRISYTLSYPKSAILRGQYHSLFVTRDSFKAEIAPCRSFGLYEEIGPLIDKGLIQGCSLANSVVIKDDAIFSKEGLFFPDEMVRHKILDLIGDLSLVGLPFTAHIIAVRSGHATHRLFAEQLLQALTMEDSA
jgi:UDP-3-O-[3-hydroxymyristoyl] N-acetylglucosamine deacetylase